MLTTRDLETALRHGCQMPGCRHSDHSLNDVFYLHPRCHPCAGTWAAYHADTPGVLHILCKQCRALVVKIAVAP